MEGREIWKELKVGLVVSGYSLTWPLFSLAADTSGSVVIHSVSFSLMRWVGPGLLYFLRVESAGGNIELMKLGVW